MTRRADSRRKIRATPIDARVSELQLARAADDSRREIASYVPRTAILPHEFGRGCFAATSRFTRQRPVLRRNITRVWRVLRVLRVRVSGVPWKARVSRSVNRNECAIAISRIFPFASKCARVFVAAITKQRRTITATGRTRRLRIGE